MSVQLRHTLKEDLDFVISAEQSADNSPYVTQWSFEQHLEAVCDNDIVHLIIVGTDGGRVGYVILAGVTGQNQSIELRRIVVTEKSKGYGREALRLVKRLAFDELGAHRLWLDVKAHNARARGLYESEGFVTEGVLRECIKAEGGFESLVLMSILRSEYLDAQGGPSAST